MILIENQHVIAPPSGCTCSSIFPITVPWVDVLAQNITPRQITDSLIQTHSSYSLFATDLRQKKREMIVLTQTLFQHACPVTVAG